MDTKNWKPSELLTTYDLIAKAAIAHLDQQDEAAWLTTTDLAKALAGTEVTNDIHQWIWNVLNPRVLAKRPDLARYAHRGPERLIMGKVSRPLIWRKPKGD